ncbi:glycine/D-amino acid oxidase-like deaminating enzyme [Allocatelliglobosispora scoriae]|uniref:Glycine/D-amino acid oxidase-like deaminating enzyme n=1 Tax=Allocatelliglobosispora scoriae TaxID=643052 RepID=A0A841BTR6_9ACTN|nr:FAD-dependent oxidoreductase [Allocatelliglobosispora scoriae]MBB5870170.1 glycine/D-amino acid oxidase-like deaminating enzyme [Allocatelliglobosispora scoriae]
MSTTTTEVAVIGAGIVGAACALACASRGLRVTVLERGGLVAGTTGSGEGNLLVSDKSPGPELTLALRSNELWRSLGEELGSRINIELEFKGGLIVARSDAALAMLAQAAREQAAAGVAAELIGADALPELEPEIARDFAGGVFYPQDMQVQPARATVAMLAAARALGAVVRARTEALRIEPGRVITSGEPVSAGAIVNATGAWALPFSPGQEIAPRRGFILVTEAMPPLIRHKVYSADYLENVASDDADLQSSTVVEATPAGPVLIGATRERVGFDTAPNPVALAALARGAAALFPFLSGVRIIRSYHGFRPFAADHLPVIGPDPEVPGLYHAHGHEGAGIGLAPATAELIAQMITGAPLAMDAAPFDPRRFA